MLTGEPRMSGWRHPIVFTPIIALLLGPYTGVRAEGSIKRTDPFEQRFPPDQAPTPPDGEKPPSAPPVREAPTQSLADQVRARPNALKTGRASSTGVQQSEKLAMVSLANPAN